jgi:hypothetical protein
VVDAAAFELPVERYPVTVVCSAKGGSGRCAGNA